MEIVGVVVYTSGVMRMKENLPFYREFNTRRIDDKVAAFRVG